MYKEIVLALIIVGVFAILLIVVSLHTILQCIKEQKAYSKIVRDISERLTRMGKS